MIILGLGSNLGDRLANLRQALLALKSIPGFSVTQVSPVYLSAALLPENAPPDWNKAYLNCAITAETMVAPDELLLRIKNIEQSFGRDQQAARWQPRMIDIDILAWHDMVINQAQLTIPHPQLLDRPFALWPLADIAPFWLIPAAGKTAAEMVAPWGSRFSGLAPLQTKQINQRVDTPQLVGIINITPDSFSDGGRYLAAEKAVQQAVDLVTAGANVLDIGAESTAPHASPIDVATEWQRLEPVLAGIKNAKDKFLIPPKLSIDTRHAVVARKAMRIGIDWINDVTGLTDPTMRALVAAAGVDCVMMHHLHIPEDRQQVFSLGEDIVSIILLWAEKQLRQLEEAGIPRTKIIFDPGIGFGKLAEHSFLLIKQIQTFSQLGCRLLVGHSRKSFLALFSEKPAADRDIETLGFSLYLAKQGVDFLRVHQVDMCACALRIAAITTSATVGFVE